MDSFESQVADDSTMHILRELLTASAKNAADRFPNTAQREKALAELNATSGVVGNILANIIGEGEGPELHGVRVDAARYILGLPNLELQTPQ